jgi:vacuolar protein sorting-associated protein 72
MNLANQRERRTNAGSKMAKLLNEEEEDEFYKTAYGGFNEVKLELLFNIVIKN